MAVYHLGVAGVRQLARPIACAMGKGVNMHPSLQRTLAQTAKTHKTAEKEVIEMVAEHLVIHTIALSALVYYITSNDQEIERKQKELDELKQEVQQQHQKFLLLR
ncbi:hypothetical protein R3W88_020204 [Solanum pinnatisectum]|uniref:Uncharacterized protein n=1 Tax=Solanum pinnatisectum TaxID=50273 RepID=A0AAV9KQQ7_9SOLN|nr:hypothetical protein R3W88_020204 [Solanum pinnatisectum]